MSNRITNDRFIPLRTTDNNDLSKYLLKHDIGDDPYSKNLFQRFFSLEKQPPILNFTPLKKFTPITITTTIQHKRQFPHSPQSLDAPELSQDVLCHPLASCKKTLAVVLAKTIYSYDLDQRTIDQLITEQEAPFCIDLMSNGTLLNYGTENGVLKHYSIEDQIEIASFTLPELATVLCHDEKSMYAGRYDGKILFWDLRTDSQKTIQTFTNCEVYNIELQNKLMATSFGNGMIKVWDIRKTEKPVALFNQFNTAVRALSWHPSGTLFAGGGSHIKILDVNSNKILSSIDSGTAVTNIHTNRDELISCHGDGKCKLWKINNKTLEFQSASDDMGSPINYSSLADEDTTLITAMDETIKIWRNMFITPPPEKKSEPFEFQIR